MVHTFATISKVSFYLESIQHSIMQLNKMIVNYEKTIIRIYWGSHKFFRWYFGRSYFGLIVERTFLGGLKSYKNFSMGGYKLAAYFEAIFGGLF